MNQNKNKKLLLVHFFVILVQYCYIYNSRMFSVTSVCLQSKVKKIKNETRFTGWFAGTSPIVSIKCTYMVPAIIISKIVLDDISILVTIVSQDPASSVLLCYNIYHVGPGDTLTPGRLKVHCMWSGVEICIFLAALSSSRRLVVGWSVGRPLWKSDL